MNTSVKRILWWCNFMVLMNFSFMKSLKSDDMGMPLHDMEKIGEDFLKKLGIPNKFRKKKVHSNVPFTPYIRNRYLELNGLSGERLHNLRPVIRIISPKTMQNHGNITFDLHDERSHFKNISKVELVFKKPQGREIQLIVISDMEGLFPTLTDEGFITDVTSQFKQRRRGRYMSVKLRGKHHGKLRHLSPLLVIFDQVPLSIIRHNQHERQRRGLREQTMGINRTIASSSTAEEHNYCRIKTWEVNFGLLGWTHIIEPTRLQINYCVGRCPSPLYEDYFNATNYAFIINQYHVRTNFRDTSVPNSTCVPAQYHHQAVLYVVDSDNFEMDIFENMIVASCGCV